MRKRFISHLTVLAMTVSMLPSAAIHAAEFSAHEYGAGDGISIAEIAKGNVYYGQLKHPQMLGNAYAYVGSVTQWEESATPILWDAMGEELDENGNGDGKLAMLSKHILNTSDFNEDKSTVNDYSASYMSEWMNDEENGFLNDENFTAAEKSAMAETEVVTAGFNTSGEKIDETAKKITQKVYLPWGTPSTYTDTFPSVYWSASQLTGKNLIASSLRNQGAAMKGKNTEIRYWLRTPVADSNGTREFVVDRTSASASQYPRVFSQYVNAQLGIRPVTKLDKDSILFASKIAANPADYTETAASLPHLAPGDEPETNYKLTVTAGKGHQNPYSFVVSGFENNQIIPVTMGNDIKLDIENISHYGTDYTINYKAVMPVNGTRTIIYGGSENVLADNAELAVPSDKFIRTTAEADSIDLYVWLQKNNAYSSNEASEPLHYEISLTGGTPSVTPTPTPEVLPSETAEKIHLTYPDGKMKAAILSFDDLADYHYFSDKHIVDIFNKYGIKSAFHMITGQVADGGLVMNNISEFDGHEISSHSVTHPHMGELTNEEFCAELNNSKTFIEQLTGKSVAGLAYPFYYLADTEHLQYVKDAGYRYSRRTDPSDTFTIPSSFYNWNPTMHVLWNGGVTDGEYVLPDRTNNFINLDAGNEEKLMFIWGHSTDFGNFEGTDGYNSDNDNWYLIENFCKSISENFDTIWNPTVIDYVDYVNSQKLFGMYKGTGDNILFDNTHGTKDVWVDISGEAVSIPAGVSVEVNSEDLDITINPTPTPSPTPTPTPTATPTAEPTAAPSGDDVLMVCDFENNAKLPVTSTGTAAAAEVSSPLAGSLGKIAPSTAAKFTEDDIETNTAAWAEADLKNKDKDNTVLKLTGTAAADENKVTLYEGKLPKDFAFDFSVLAYPAFANTVIAVEQDGVSYGIFRYDQWSSVYLTNSTTRYTMESAGVWLPHTMIFSDFATENTKLSIYLNGRLNYTAAAANPQGYDNARLEQGDYYSGLDLSKDVKLTIAVKGAVDSLYFDNIRLYKYSNSVSSKVENNFENDTLRMNPVQNGIRTGGYIGRQWLYVSTDKKQQNYGLIGYETTVERDPHNPSNKVLRLIRGEGSNEYSYDNAVRFRVAKPEKKLAVSFKALTNTIFNMAVDIADGNFEDVFYMDEKKTPADRFFSLGQDAKGQFAASGRYSGKYAADLGWELDKWNDVSIVYDIENNKTHFNVNGNEFDTIPNPNSEILTHIMASDKDEITVNIFRPYPTKGTYLMIDDISIVSDEYTPTPTPTPTVTPTPTPTPTPSVTPTPTPTPTDKPEFEGEWQSELYPNGAESDSDHPEYIKDMGEIKTINKVVLDHDSAKIMSFSVSVSENGTDYTRVTSVYAGATAKNSGRQVYRFAPRNARYIKYSPILLGRHETQAIVNSITASQTTTVSIVLNNIPKEVNPVAGRVDIVLNTDITDSDGDTYTAAKDGVEYIAENRIDGNVLTIERNAGESIISITAKDLSNGVTTNASISVKPRVAIRNAGIYADAEGTENVKEIKAGMTVYVKTDALTSETLGEKAVKLFIALYNADGTLAGANVTDAKVKSTSAYEAVTAAYTLLEKISENVYIKAFIWDENQESLTETLIKSDNAAVCGFADASVFIKKSDTKQIRLSAEAENVLWESSDETVAKADNSGNITGIGEGTAVITAKSGDAVLGSAEVRVEPVYVFLCMGQSNMSAMTNSSLQEKEPFEVPVSTGVLLLNKQNKFEQAKHSYGRHTGIVETGGGTDAGELNMPDRINMTYSFAEDFKKDYPGSEIGLIVNSRVGCRIDVFEKNSETGNGFANSVERAVSEEVKTKGELMSILWHQGENNGSDADYTYTWRNLMYDFRAALGNAELPVVAGGLAEDKPVSNNNSGALLFNDRLSAEKANIADFGFASSRYPYVLTVNATDSTNENRQKDESHFSAKSQIEFGHRYYKAYKNIIGKTN